MPSLLCIFCVEEFHPIILVLKKAVLEQLTTKLLISSWGDTNLCSSGSKALSCNSSSLGTRNISLRFRSDSGACSSSGKLRSNSSNRPSPAGVETAGVLTLTTEGGLRWPRSSPLQPPSPVQTHLQASEPPHRAPVAGKQPRTRRPRCEPPRQDKLGK